MALFDTVKLDEIVFEKRNKEYGAYILRRIYRKYVITSLIISVFVILAIIIPPFIMASLNKDKKILVTQNLEANLADLDMPVDEEEPPPPPPPPPPPALEQQVKFTAPIVVDTVEEKVEIATTEDIVTTTTNEAVITEEIVEEKTSEVIEVKEEIPVFIVVEEMPVFPGGEEALLKYIQEHIEYPQVARELGVSGKVYVQFVVNENGKIQDVKVMRGVDPSLDKEAIRVIESLPEWTPGKQRGKAVRVMFTIPINFALN
ncbi:MAG: energy transducer TonB [Bacteroidia bacterium]|nr:energy transducer TonB [Bacteroidia bacterium]